MEEQVVRTMELINDALESLPPYASQAWGMMVQWHRVDGIINVVAYLALIAVGVILIYIGMKALAKPKRNRVYSKDAYGLIVFIGGVLIFFSVVPLIIGSSLRMAIIPEYDLVLKIIRGVTN